MIKVKPMTIEHIKKIHQIEELSFPEDPWPLPAFEMELKNPNAIYMVACKNGVVLGYAGMHHIMDVAEIVNMAVSPSFRGQKIGNQLMEGLLTRAFDLGVTTISLEVRQTNYNAIKLYQNHGFTAIATRYNYYKKPSENAIVMQKISRHGGKP